MTCHHHHVVFLGFIDLVAPISSPSQQLLSPQHGPCMGPPFTSPGIDTRYSVSSERHVQSGVNRITQVPKNNHAHCRALCGNRQLFLSIHSMDDGASVYSASVCKKVDWKKNLQNAMCKQTFAKCL